MFSSLSRFVVIARLISDDDQLDEAMPSVGALATLSVASGRPRPGPRWTAGHLAGLAGKVRAGFRKEKINGFHRSPLN
jgi:hypothetical protein